MDVSGEMDNQADSSLSAEDHGYLNGDYSSNSQSDFRDVSQAKHFTTNERLLLLKLLLEHVDVLSSKETTLLHVKRAIWQHISANYHSQDGVECRTLRQLQKFWENYKARRKRALERGATLKKLLEEDIHDLQDSADSESAIMGQIVKAELPEDRAGSAEQHGNDRLEMASDQDSRELGDPAPETDVTLLRRPPIRSTPPKEHYQVPNHGPPALIRFSDVQIIPVSQKKRKTSQVTPTPVVEKKPRNEAAEAYYEMKIQHAIEKHELEKQILRQKLENMIREHEKQLQVLNVEVAFKEELHNAKMAILKGKLDSILS